jgi:radical SAM protein with 4Fe4S-binding SPASM domain
MWPVRRVPRTPCRRAMNQIMVLWDGRVSLCCFDAEGAVILGDLNHQSLRDVYNGTIALGIRQAHHEGRRGELALCKDCTAI